MAEPNGGPDKEGGRCHELHWLYPDTNIAQGARVSQR